MTSSGLSVCLVGTGPVQGRARALVFGQERLTSKSTMDKQQNDQFKNRMGVFKNKGKDQDVSVTVWRCVVTGNTLFHTSIWHP